MKSFLLFALSIILTPSPQGYVLSGNNIQFSYASDIPNLEVIVSGNFNSWSKEKEWKMKFEATKGYVLAKPISSIYRPGKSFYEFTFRVNGKLIDANKNAPNVVHCVGYGSRYLIHFDENQLPGWRVNCIRNI